MLKSRVIPTLLYRDGNLRKGQGFDSWRSVSTAIEAVRIYTMREVDELVFLDIEATAAGRGPDLGLVRDLADSCNVPFSVGGGIRTAGQAVDLVMEGGADKVVLNTGAFECPGLVGAVAERLGSQAVIVSVDARPRADGSGHDAFIRNGTVPTGLTAVDLARRYEEEGAGEILLTSIPRDGTMSGYDLDLLASVSDAVRLPVIASGGAGGPDHMFEALSVARVHAVAASAVFLFTALTPREAKLHLRGKGCAVRL